MMCDVKWQWAAVLSQAVVAMEIQRGAVALLGKLFLKPFMEEKWKRSAGLSLWGYMYLLSLDFWGFVSFLFLFFFFFFWVMGVGSGAGFHFCRWANKGKSEFESLQGEREDTCFPVWSPVRGNAPHSFQIHRTAVPSWLSLSLPSSLPPPLRYIYHCPI